MIRTISVTTTEAKRLQVACQLRAGAALKIRSNRRAGMWKSLAERFAKPVPRKRGRPRMRK